MKHLCSIVGACLIAALLSACGGTSTQFSSTSPLDTAPSAHAAARKQPLPRTSSFSCLTSKCVYVGSEGYVDIYPANATGNVSPIEQIQDGAEGLAVDASHNVYATQTYPGGVNVYGPGAYGNVAPTQTISGSKTGLGNAPRGVAVDASGNIYVANWNDSNVTVYAAGANGNVSPIRTIGGSKTGLFSPLGVALDASNNIYVANCCEGSSDRDGAVTVYAAGTNGNVSPIQTISGSNTALVYPYGIALDAADDIYVTSAGSINIFAAGASGNVSPIRTIAGAKTKATNPIGVAVGTGGKVYVLDNFRPAAVIVFAAHASGNVKPIQKIHGSNTGLKLPIAFAER